MTGEEPLVLIAEDEPLASMALRAQVETLGFQVAAVARTGTEAVALVRTLPIELAIFDMKMPAMSGLEAAVDSFSESLTPVVLLTGFGAADLPDPIPRPPIFALITKPVGLTELGRGIGAARDRFQAWVDAGDHAGDVGASLDDRRAISRALEGERDGPTAAAAARFLQRARDEGLAPAALARRILAPASQRDR